MNLEIKILDPRLEDDAATCGLAGGMQMIPSMLQQITAACVQRPTERPSPRKLRQENILMLMLGRNVTALDLSRHQKKSLRTVVDDLRELVDAGHVFSYSPSGLEYRGRMYSLTSAGILRAKQLKEMGE